MRLVAYRFLSCRVVDQIPIPQYRVVSPNAGVGGASVDTSVAANPFTAKGRKSLDAVRARV